MGRSADLQLRTMRIIYQRLLQVADSRGCIDKDTIRETFRRWRKEDTDVEAIAAAGHIRKMITVGTWTDADWVAWERHHTVRFATSVKRFIRLMDKAGSNRFDRVPPGSVRSTGATKPR